MINRTPWHIEKCRCGDPVCNQYTIEPVQHSVGFAREHALKMAASPEMYEALHFIVSQVTDPANGGHALDAFARGAGISMARAALAKAEGR